MWVRIGSAACIISVLAGMVPAAERVAVTVDHAEAGAPITMGMPFPKGALYSPDHVRVLNATGSEIPSQVTEVTTWEPADTSIKWVWVFFFADDTPDYFIEYGSDVRRSAVAHDHVVITNNQRERGWVEVNTGPLRFTVNHRGAGFFDRVELERDGHATEIVAAGDAHRGSFLDLMEGDVLHESHAVIKQSFVELGSGPLHGVIRLEGEYRYEDEAKNPSPFVMRIHSYAGQSFVRVLHTITYTGEPDRSAPLEGEHAQIATQPYDIVDEEARLQDPDLRIPGDRIAAAGLSLNYVLSPSKDVAAGYRSGVWWGDGEARILELPLQAGQSASVVQSGPRLDTTATLPEDEPWFLRMPPIPRSGPDARLEGAFRASIQSAGEPVIDAERAEGWLDLYDGERGISVGIRNFVEEYPKELRVDGASRLTAYAWSPSDEPMSFARWSDRMDLGMAGNFAQGLTKTTEYIFYFRNGPEDLSDTRRVLYYVLDPPVARLEPEWYARSEAFGLFAPAGPLPEYERGLDYKYRWMLFNRKWEPWYGMFYYGDWLTYYVGDRWIQWNLNEPAIDFMWWLQFMRTGNREYYLAAEASSRHSMDVGNIHWPAWPRYRGDTNPASDYWEWTREPPGSPYVGMGRRHSNEPWVGLLTAHVWVQGWLAAYHLTGYHRALDVAELTGEMYLRRSWGEHGLTARRLYNSVLNLSELYDATKDERYFVELQERVGRMLRLQRGQGGSLIMDRYGYAQIYASHGLRKYWQMTGDSEVRRAMVRHARRLRDVPPLDHEMESYLSSIHGLLVGYELTGDGSFLDEAVQRARFLVTDALPRPFESYATQRELAEALENASRLPPALGDRPPIWAITNGLRVFGWTHAFNVPYLLYWLE